MLNICDEFGTEFEVMFNLSKYQLLHYCTNRKSVEIIIHINQVIECQSFVTHLGYMNVGCFGHGCFGLGRSGHGHFAQAIFKGGRFGQI